MLVDCFAQSLFLVTIGKQNYPLAWYEMRTTLKLKASDIQQTEDTLRPDP